MDFGALNRRVTFQSRTAGQDAAGQPLLTWVDVATVWVNIRGETGMGVIRGGAPQEGVAAAVSNFSLRGRYRTDITEGMRAVEEGTGTVFDIRVVQHDMAGQKYTDWVCTRGGSDG